MKNFLKKTLSFLILLSLSLSLAPLALAEDCVNQETAGKNMLKPSNTASYILSELNEPISAFDEVITDSNGVTISKVFLKYKKNPSDSNENPEWLYCDSSNTCPATAEYCTYVQLILSQSGTGLLKTYIAIIYRWAAGIVGIICVLVIVISGIQISMDQGSGESVGSAKNRIMQSLAGLVILFLSALILYTVNPTFFT